MSKQGWLFAGLFVTLLASIFLNLRFVLLIQQLERNDYLLRATLEVSGFCLNASDQNGVFNVSIGFFAGYPDEVSYAIPHESVTTDEQGYYRLIFQVLKAYVIENEAVELLGSLPGHFVTFSTTYHIAEISLEDIVWGAYGGGGGGVYPSPNTFQINFTVFEVIII